MGADALWSRGVLGQGQTVAVIDKGFAGLDRSIALGELPPREEMTIQLFDPASGLDGSDEFGLPSQHGVRMAELVHDMAPDAHLVLVGYRTMEQFAQAAAWIAAQGIPIVSHSNSFLTPPFDGTGPAARAVDAAARRACSGSTRRATSPSATGAASRPRRAPSIPIAPDGRRRRCCSAWPGPRPPVTASVAVERQDAAGAWAEVQRSTAAVADQRGHRRPRSPTAAPTGWWCARTPGRPGRARPLLARRSASARLAVADGSIPTPGDARRRAHRGRGEVDRRRARALLVAGRAPAPGKPDLVGPDLRDLQPGVARHRGHLGGDAPTSPGPPCCCARRAWPPGLPAGAGRPAGALLDGRRARTSAPPGPDPVYGAGMARARHLRARAARCASARGATGSCGCARRRRRYDPPGADLHERARLRVGPAAGGGRAPARAAARRRQAHRHRRGHGRQRGGPHAHAAGPAR